MGPALNDLQPEHRGLPQPIRRTLWTAAQLAARGMRDPWNNQGEAYRADGLVVREARAPRPVADCGRWVVYEAAWPLRRGGGVYAVYDRRRDVHRWVFGAPLPNGRVLAASDDWHASLRWACGEGDVAVADVALLLDLARATAHRVRFPEFHAWGFAPTAEGWAFEFARDMSGREGRDRRVVPWAAVRAALDVALTASPADEQGGVAAPGVASSSPASASSPFP